MNETSLPEMREWLRRINYAPDDLNSLNMIHVTGTKGKGSTCAFVSSILQHLYPEKKIGLFTSPHLKAVSISRPEEGHVYEEHCKLPVGSHSFERRA